MYVQRADSKIEQTRAVREGILHEREPLLAHRYKSDKQAR